MIGVVKILLLVILMVGTWELLPHLDDVAIFCGKTVVEHPLSSSTAGVFVLVTQWLAFNWWGRRLSDRLFRFYNAHDVADQVSIRAVRKEAYPQGSTVGSKIWDAMSLPTLAMFGVALVVWRFFSSSAQTKPSKPSKISEQPGDMKIISLGFGRKIETYSPGSRAREPRG